MSSKVKRYLFTVLLILLSAALNFAQDPEQVDLLTPVALRKLPKLAKHLITIKDFESKVKIDSVNLPNGKLATAITVDTACDQLVYERTVGKNIARLYYYLRIRSNGKEIDGFAEGDQDFEATDDELKAVGVCHPNRIRKLFELPPGFYRVDVIVRNLIVGNHSYNALAFKVNTN